MASATRTHRTLFRAVALACLLVIGLQTAGCRTAVRMIDKEYYFLEPDPISLEAKAEILCVPNAPPIPADQAVLVPSDRVVRIHAYCIKKMLRARMNLARIARLTSSTFAVLTAASAAALGAVATAPLTAITALAASSAVIPEFMRIFGAGERAKAYEEGVHLIEGAQVDYMTSRVGLPPVSPQELTAAGATLHMQVVAALTIVEHLLVAQLPRVEDIQIAQGRIRATAAAQVKVSVVQEISKRLVRTTDTDAASRQVAYKVTVKNVSAAPIRSAILNVHVRGAKAQKNAAGVVTSKGWQEGAATNTTCVVEGDKDLRCTITSLAPDGVVIVPVTATVHDASAPERLYFVPEVWEEPTKLHVSGPVSAEVVDVEKAPTP